MNTQFINKIFTIKSEAEFSSIALDIFNYQLENNIIYKKYIDSLGLEKSKIKTLDQIPFLPISFFKTHKIYSSRSDVKTIFESSGTTSQNKSKHYVAETDVYEHSFVAGFEKTYGNIADFTILALLPSYLEKGNSSLVFMVKKLIELSKDSDSGFFLHNYDELVKKLNLCEKRQKKYVLIGVSY